MNCQKVWAFQKMRTKKTYLCSQAVTKFAYSSPGLFGHPDGLLLEPTNALDIDSIRWLESSMNYEGALVVISHDRHFLNAVCTKIADIDYETIIVYPGNYDDMVAAKRRRAQHLKWQTQLRKEEN